MAHSREKHDQLLVSIRIVSAYVGNNPVRAEDVPELIASVHQRVCDLVEEKKEVVPPPKPAIAIKKSITDDYLVCLEDGERVKLLKPYLKKFGLTPQDYRQRWGLAEDYPMTAPAYTRQRSEMARKNGLGRKRKDQPNQLLAEAEQV